MDVTFTPLPAHVRTARLVALAMARRVGVAEDTLDEVRLAVGEACSRAVGVHTNRAPETPVRMRLCDDDSRFTVEVTDVGPLEDDPEPGLSSLDAARLAATVGTDGSLDALPPGFGLVVIGGLVEEVLVTSDPAGTHVTMAWPISRTGNGGG
ncbi:MAG TPA: ATP-binding protein [Mycobacteriales bacterium]|nr:ATP-binding protein [Mycobacteriales bacterium]